MCGWIGYVGPGDDRLVSLALWGHGCGGVENMGSVEGRPGKSKRIFQKYVSTELLRRRLLHCVSGFFYSFIFLIQQTFVGSHVQGVGYTVSNKEGIAVALKELTVSWGCRQEAPTLTNMRVMREK